jgi:adenylosuccinate lyase
MEGLVVRPERMRANVDAGKGLFFSQRLLSTLVESGMGRDEAYRVVQRHAMRAWEEGLDLRELARGDADLAGRVDLDDVFMLDAYTAHVDTIFDRLRALVTARDAAVNV